MKKEVMNIMVCPACRGKLELNIEEQRDNEIITGSMNCPRCGINYPITDNIPRMLPPERLN